jgi:hypothetical protein
MQTNGSLERDFGSIRKQVRRSISFRVRHP